MYLLGGKNMCQCVGVCVFWVRWIKRWLRADAAMHHFPLRSQDMSQTSISMPLTHVKEKHPHRRTLILGIVCFSKAKQTLERSSQCRHRDCVCACVCVASGSKGGSGSLSAEIQIRMAK